MNPPDIVIRPAVKSDVPALGRLGASLMRQHFEFDPLRFLRPGDKPEEGYAWFLGTQLNRDDATIFVADHQGVVIGYAYAAVEPLSWEDLGDECGVIHDLVVDATAQQRGIGTALMQSALAWMRHRGLARAVLSTSPRNERAQRLFDRLGFRRTMIEMTRELSEDDGKE